MSPAEWIALLKENGKALREAGIESMSLSADGDIAITLAKHEPPLPDFNVRDSSPDLDGDPLNDPLTFGRTSGLPGYDMRRGIEDEE